jgi:hypothetical protein
MITSDLIKRITDKFTNRANYDYFFNQLDDAQWIAPLQKAGFFKIPPPPVKEDGYISFPGWPESQYLLRMADRAPVEVMEITRDIPDSDNPWVSEDIANIALTLPPKQSVKLLERLKQSSTSPYQRILANSLAEIIVKWAVAGSYTVAVSLAETLLALEKDEKEFTGYKFTEPKAKLGSHDYHETIEKITPPLTTGSTKALELTVGLYCKLLKTAIEYRYQIKDDEDEDTLEDYSQIWRRDITKDRQSGAYDQPRQSLVTGLRMALDTLLNRNDVSADEKKKILESVVSNRYKVFVRISEYVLREHATQEPLKSLYTSLEKIADAVEDKEIALRDPEEGYWVDDRSHKITNDIRKLDNEALLEKIKSIPIDHSSIMGGSRFIGELTDLFADNLQRYMELGKRLKDMGLPYLSALVEASERKSRESYTPADFESIGTLLQIAEESLEDTTKEEYRPYGEWVKASVLRLLENTLRQKEQRETIHAEYREAVQSIVLTLSRDPEPTSEDDEKHGDNMDAPSVSVNTIRGIAMHTLMQYGLWLKRNEKEIGPEGYSQALDAVFIELDYHLDPENDPSPAIRAVYGQWFPWLDMLRPTWAKQAASKIFSVDKHGAAAWDAYLSFCAAYDNLLPLMKPLLGQYIESLVEESKRNIKSHGTARTNFAEHLMIYYLRGKLSLDDPLLRKFFEEAPLEIRQHGIEFIGRVAYENDTLTEVNIERMKKLWEARVTEISLMDADKSKANAPELEMFGRWFAASIFDEKWRVENLLKALQLAKTIEPDFMVLDKLVEISERYTLESVQCLTEMVNGASARERWVVTSWDDNARRILSTALNSSDAEIKKMANELINRLLSKGYYSFKDLV